MNLLEILDDRVTAAVVAAAGTIIGALIQLRIAWRKEVSERARGVPLNKKSRRGPVLAVFLLVFAAGVGGFALSQYLVGQTVRDSAALQSQLQAQLARLGDAAARIEQASLAGHGPAGDAAGCGPGAAAPAAAQPVVSPLAPQAATERFDRSALADEPR